MTGAPELSIGAISPSFSPPRATLHKKPPPASRVNSASLPSRKILRPSNDEPTPTSAQSAFRKSRRLYRSTTARRHKAGKCGRGARKNLNRHNDKLICNSTPPGRGRKICVKFDARLVRKVLRISRGYVRDKASQGRLVRLRSNRAFGEAMIGLTTNYTIPLHRQDPDGGHVKHRSHTNHCAVSKFSASPPPKLAAKGIRRGHRQLQPRSPPPARSATRVNGDQHYFLHQHDLRTEPTAR